MAMVFQLQKTTVGNAVDQCAATKFALADIDELCVPQALHAPIEAAVGVLFSRQQHHLEELLVSNKLGVAHNPQDGNIALPADRTCALGVSHGDQFRLEPDLQPASIRRPIGNGPAATTAITRTWYEA